MIHERSLPETLFYMGLRDNTNYDVERLVLHLIDLGKTKEFALKLIEVVGNPSTQTTDELVLAVLRATNAQIYEAAVAVTGVEPSPWVQPPPTPAKNTEDSNA